MDIVEVTPASVLEFCKIALADKINRGELTIYDVEQSLKRGSHETDLESYNCAALKRAAV